MKVESRLHQHSFNFDFWSDGGLRKQQLGQAFWLWMMRASWVVLASALFGGRGVSQCSPISLPGVRLQSLWASFNLMALIILKFPPDTSGKSTTAA